MTNTSVYKADPIFTGPGHGKIMLILTLLIGTEVYASMMNRVPFKSNTQLP